MSAQKTEAPARKGTDEMRACAARIQKLVDEGRRAAKARQDAAAAVAVVPVSATS